MACASATTSASYDVTATVTAGGATLDLKGLDAILATYGSQTGAPVMLREVDANGLTTQAVGMGGNCCVVVTAYAVTPVVINIDACVCTAC